MGKLINFPGQESSYAKMTELERAQAQIQMLIGYLDKNDPNWRVKMRESLDGN